MHKVTKVKQKQVKLLFVISLSSVISINIYYRQLQNSNSAVVNFASPSSSSSTSSSLSLESTTRKIEQVIESMCSMKASKYRPGQKVVSYSLFNKAKSLDSYVSGIDYNLQKIRELYPGWLMRLYTDLNDEIGNLTRLLSEPDFFICNTTNLPGIAIITTQDAMLWRDFPIGDPTVDIFIARDLDSVISKREISAVNQWLESNKTFHSMRDNTYHIAKVMGGLWGAKNTELEPGIRRNLLLQFSTGNFSTKMNDEDILGEVLYTNFKSRFMIHDSYLCEKNNDSIPFPTRREDDKSHVGQYIDTYKNPDIFPPCPVACRPSYGQNWTYC